MGEILIERDYSNGLLVRFDETFPEALNGKVTPEEFAHTIQHINLLFRQAETYTWLTCLESFVACATLYTYYICFRPKYSKLMKRLERFLQLENENVYADKGIEWLNPVRNGLLHVTLLVHNK